MAVDFITPLIKAAVELLARALAHARRRLGKKKYERLLSTAITDLLKEHPDIDEAKARIAALEAIGVPPAADLLRAKSILKAVETHSTKEKRAKKPGRTKRKGAAAKGRKAA